MKWNNTILSFILSIEIYGLPSSLVETANVMSWSKVQSMTSWHEVSDKEKEVSHSGCNFLDVNLLTPIYTFFKHLNWSWSTNTDSIQIRRIKERRPQSNKTKRMNDPKVGILFVNTRGCFRLQYPPPSLAVGLPALPFSIGWITEIRGDCIRFNFGSRMNEA